MLHPDSIPVISFTKEQIEEIVENKFRELMEREEEHKELIGKDFLEMADNIDKTGAGRRHTEKKRESRAIIREFPNEKQLKNWLSNQLFAGVIFTIEEKEDGTFIVY